MYISLVYKHHFLIPFLFYINLFIQFIQVQSNVFATERHTAKSVPVLHTVGLDKHTQGHQRRYEKLTNKHKKIRCPLSRLRFSYFLLSFRL
jgi:hypothetical protein